MSNLSRCVDFANGLKRTLAEIPEEQLAELASGELGAASATYRDLHRTIQALGAKVGTAGLPTPE